VKVRRSEKRSEKRSDELKTASLVSKPHTLVLPYKTRLLCNHRNNSHHSSQHLSRFASLIAEWKVDAKGDDEDDKDDEWTAGVFPGCGHVVSFNVEMERGLQCCPLCRRESKLKMLNISFIPAVTHADIAPTHVFNPCGCAASEECCEFWSNIKVKHPPTPGNSNVSLCPFCATTLAEDNKFSRIITGHEVKIGKEEGIVGMESKT